MKRALVVDDSRSARVILSRTLEAYGLAADACDSAEQALEFLAHTRPDVIFMDHLMPGMDGFQAVRALKNTPATAAIPIMMYTSQDDDIYLDQARAVGAIGVLPKNFGQSELSRALYQLGVLADRRESRAVVHPPERRPAVVAADSASLQAPPPQSAEIAINAVAPMLQEHAAETRRLVQSGFDALATRIIGEMKSVAADAEPAAARRESWRWPLAAAAAMLALTPTAVLAVLYKHTLDSMHALAQSNAQLASVVDEQQTQLAALARSAAMAAANAPITGAFVESELVPYAEAPLAGSRLERLRTMIDNLKAGGFRGRIRIAAYVGEFCLAGNGVHGYALAADDLPARRCDLIGNPASDSLSAAQRQSAEFVALLAAVRQQSEAGLTIEVRHEGRRPLAPYPQGERLAAATAGEWNRIAAQNNRVEFAAEPTG